MHGNSFIFKEAEQTMPCTTFVISLVMDPLYSHLFSFEGNWTNNAQRHVYNMLFYCNRSADMKWGINWRNKDILVCCNGRANQDWQVPHHEQTFTTDIEVTINKFFKIYNEQHDLASCSKIETICSTNLVTIPPIQRQWTYFLHSLLCGW